MKDIFLSYSRDDQATARRFAEGLERAGFSVWWDVTLRSGEDYDKVTEAALESAKAVVVLWSKKSVESRWVRAEATQADRNHTLVPVMIEPCKRPLMFELKQTAELGHWKGDANDAAWLSFVNDVKRFVQSDHVTPTLAQPVSRLRKRLLSIDLLIAAVVVVAIALTLLWRQIGPADTSSNAAATALAATTTKSIAVLPFANLSSDPEQEYFSDGLAEELLNKLAQVKNLEVAARTSSFYFKGRNEPMKSIGETLGVKHILEGSVRKGGSQLRITARLIKAEDGKEVWAATYDRDMSDIFKVQDEISQAVTTALSISLGAGEFERPGMTRNVAAYNAYLKGNAETAANGITSTAITTAIEHMKEAVKLDPGFGLAWLRLRYLYFDGRVNTLPREQTRDFGDLQKDALQQARKAAPIMPELLLIDATEARTAGHWQAAEKLYQQILQKDEATSAGANMGYGALLNAAGRNADALPYLLRAKRLDPLQPDYSIRIAEALLDLGRVEEAVSEANRGMNFGNAQANVYLGAIKMLAAYSRNDPVQAAAMVRAGGAPPGKEFIEVADLLAKGEKSATLAAIKSITAHDVSPVTFLALTVPALLAGDPALAVRLHLSALTSDQSFGPHFQTWMDIYGPVRKLPEFKEMVRKAGLVDYWRTTGHWADKCHAVGDDFECE